MCFHIKEGSPDDLENELTYKSFEKNYPDLFAQVEGWVTYSFNKFSHSIGDFERMEQILNAFNAKAVAK